MPGGQPPASDPQPNASPAAGFDHVGRATFFALLAAGLALFFVQSLRHHSWRFDSLLEAALSAPSRTRTDTVRILSPLPLPIGLWGRAELGNRNRTCHDPRHRHRWKCGAQRPTATMVGTGPCRVGKGD